MNNKTIALQEDIKGNVFTDADKQKLDSLENYDDTEVKADINLLETYKADASQLSRMIIL